MKNEVPTTIIFLRHAPSLSGGKLHGRSDVDADCSNNAAAADVARGLSAVDAIISSPARRCIQTVEAVWPNATGRPSMTTEPRLWEQNFGDWEGIPLEDLPDLSALSQQDLADHSPPNGESFSQVCERTQSALLDLVATRRGQTLCLSAHAGPIRAALALALGLPSGNALRFQVANLSTTTLHHFGPDLWSVDQVNRVVL